MTYITDYSNAPSSPSSENHFNNLFNFYTQVTSGHIKKSKIIVCPVREITVEWILGNQYCIYQFQNEQNQVYIYKGNILRFSLSHF